ncbi:hypothetical protein HDE_12241 [Halotydeus destructor]|nr:hypothetical protein HDE_12241 [Halotydeus destructor]
MSKRKKFSVDTDLAVQVDKLSRELEESKEREEQLSKLADDMIQVISNYQLEVIKKGEEIAKLKKQIQSYEGEVNVMHDVKPSSSLTSLPEVTSSGLHALCQNDTDHDRDEVSSNPESKLQTCLRNIEKIASSNKTISCLLETKALHKAERIELKNILTWFAHPTPQQMPLVYEDQIKWIKKNLKAVKVHVVSSVRKVLDINQFEQEVLAAMKFIYAGDAAAQETDMVAPQSTELQLSCSQKL